LAATQAKAQKTLANRAKNFTPNDVTRNEPCEKRKPVLHRVSRPAACLARYKKKTQQQSIFALFPLPQIAT
jgi:hypothetical protein